MSQRRKEGFVWRWRIEHFEKVHRVDPQTFKELRASLDTFTNETLPRRRALLNTAEPHLKEVAAFLDKRAPDFRNLPTTDENG